MYDISPEELKDYKAYTIVDIRDSMSYAYGHLPDAISVPQAELSTYIDEWKDAGKILIYCKRGEASLDAVLMLREQGVEAYNLDGGYMAWLMLAMQEPADQPDTDFAKDVEESSVTNAPLTTDNSSTGLSTPGVTSGSTVALKSPLISNLSALQSQFSVLALRQAEALQRWKEISQSGDSDYREQIRKHFGVNLPQSLSNLCTYIGGISRNLDISEVVNNNLAADGNTAVIAGKGVGAGNGSFTYTTDEHCVVMCIYHAVPLLDYAITGQDGQLLVTDAESLPIPEFDNIGMEVLPMTQIFNSPKASIVNLFNAGYNPRYFNWKTKLDVINGAFTTTLKSWVSPVTESLLSGWFGFGYSEGDVNKDNKVVLNYKFFKVNPSVLDPIFGVAADSTWDSDQLLVNSYIGCYVARNLSRDGVPY